MEHTTVKQRAQDISRRTFLKQVGALTGVSAGAALLSACGAATTPAATTGAASPAATTALSSSAATAGATAAAAEETTTASTTGQNATPQIVAAANAFLQTLSSTEQDTVRFPWTDTAQKQRWSNLPEGLVARTGLRMGDMSAAQQNACLAVLQAILSTEGYNRVLAAWKADDVWAALNASAASSGSPPASGGNGPPPTSFGTPYYFAAIIGTPSETEPWQWQWGGHHLAINATIVGPNIALTPSFIGVQPATYTDASGTTVRPLGDIEDEAFALINALDATQRQTAILGDTPIVEVLGPGQDGRTMQAEGLPAAQMTVEQQAALLHLIGHYTGLVNDAAAAARVAEIRSTLDNTYLAWYGSTTQGNPAYFRVTGPTLVIEYAPTGVRGQPPTAREYHVHGIYRDPANDYGAQYTGITITS